MHAQTNMHFVLLLSNTCGFGFLIPNQLNFEKRVLLRTVKIRMKCQNTQHLTRVCSVCYMYDKNDLQ